MQYTILVLNQPEDGGILNVQNISQLRIYQLTISRSQFDTLLSLGNLAIHCLTLLAIVAAGSLISNVKTNSLKPYSHL